MAAPKLTLKMLPEDVGQTLAAVLRRRLEGSHPWSRIQQMIRTRHVQVNGNVCTDAGRRLKGVDIVHVFEHSVAGPARPDDVKIRHLDSQVVVVEKPAGMTSVRHAEEQGWSEQRRRNSPTLEDLLPRVIAKKQGGVEPRPQRGKKTPPGRTPSRTVPVRPVHRLDRETSGLMVFARTIPAERHLGQQFRQHTTHRRYLAIVVGQVKAQTIRTNLARDRGDGRRGSTTLPNVGKPSVTHVKPLEDLDGYTLVECQLETGRTHQIRIHLSELGHPVCGEKVYLTRMNAPTIVDSSGAPRLALHAAELGFEHPSSEEMLKFKMPLPDDLAKFLDRLRGRSRK